MQSVITPSSANASLNDELGLDTDGALSGSKFSSPPTQSVLVGKFPLSCCFLFCNHECYRSFSCISGKHTAPQSSSVKLKAQGQSVSSTDPTPNKGKIEKLF